MREVHPLARKMVWASKLWSLTDTSPVAIRGGSPHVLHASEAVEENQTQKRYPTPYACIDLHFEKMG